MLNVHTTSRTPLEQALATMKDTSELRDDMPASIADPKAPADQTQQRSTVPADLDAIDKELATLSAHIASAKYRLLTLIDTFDRAEGWARQGFSSCAEYLGFRIGLSGGTAREHVRIARALSDVPAIAEAMERGELSFSKVRAVTRVATPENEHDLLAIACAGTAAHVEKTVRAMRRAQGAKDTQHAEAQHTARTFSLVTNEDGSLTIRGRLPAELGAVVQKAVERALEQQERNEDTKQSTHGQRMADALATVAESALSADIARGVPAERVQVVLHVERTPGYGGEPRSSTVSIAEPEALGRLFGRSLPGRQALRPAHVPAEADSHDTALQAVIEPGGAGLAEQTARRLACDASIVVQDGGSCSCGSQAVARKKRVPGLPLRRVLSRRDGGCTFPGCTHTRHLHTHHIEHWLDGGETSERNTCLLCSLHHRLCHEGGFQLKRGEDEALLFFDPRGNLVPSTPELLQSDDGEAALRALAQSARIAIDSDTMPVWQGETLDLDWAKALFRIPGSG